MSCNCCSLSTRTLVLESSSTEWNLATHSHLTCRCPSSERRNKWITSTTASAKRHSRSTSRCTALKRASTRTSLSSLPSSSHRLSWTRTKPCSSSELWKTRFVSRHTGRFYAEWCSFCRQMHDTFVQIGAAYRNDPNVVVAAMNADHYDSFLSRYDIMGFPTFKLFKKTAVKKAEPESFSGEHTFRNMVLWLNQRTGARGDSNADMLPSDAPVIHDPSKPVPLKNPHFLPKEDAPADSEQQEPAGNSDDGRTPEIKQQVEQLEAKLDELLKNSKE
mmetsp:Transcript_46036/g.99724  ORF Transcript_46036/g.99724 Transcript_46036/m.99724 type:complete len:275 (-) Transcript_46036:23-847(-)